MRVLMTGSAGRVGSVASQMLRGSGVDVVPFDLIHGQDVLDADALRSAMTGCDAVIHAAGLMEAPDGDQDRLRDVNVEGTRRALEVAASLSLRRFVFMSSAAVTGVFKGEQDPDYLPLDEAHPCHAMREYSASKRDAETLCESAALATRMSVTTLRPPGVWTEQTYHRIVEARRRDPSYEWSPFWEYGAFVDARDLASACSAALTAPISGYHCMFIASSDVSTSGRTSRQLARDLMPRVPWRGDASYDSEPFQTLVRIDRARSLLGWEPRFTWQRFLRSRSTG